MITFNDDKQFNWTLTYNDLNGVQIASGKVFNKIPRKGDYVCFNDTIYEVNYVLFDYDSSNILVEIETHIKNNNDFICTHS